MTPPLRSIGRLVTLVALSAAYLGCRDRVLDPSPACASTSGTWIVASRDPVFGPRVLILKVSPESSVTVSELPSRAADGTVGVALAPASITGSASCGTFEAAAQLATTSLDVWLHLAIVGDTAEGIVATPEHTSPLFGLRIDPALLASADSFPLQKSPVDSTPVLLLRIDDATATDHDFLPRLTKRGLTGEMAIPTWLVGKPGFLTWDEVKAWAQRGFSIAAHSRRHSPATDAGFGFMSEVVGSLADLRSQDLVTSIFVQPGSWRDSIYFDSPAKLANWRGALFRNVTQVFEGYATPSTVPEGMTGHVAFGVSHFSVSDGATPGWVMTQWHQMFVRGSFTVFLIHSVSVQPADKLDWLLDSISAAVFQGRLKLATSAADLVENR